MTRTRFWMLATAVATLVSTSAVFAQTAQTRHPRASKPGPAARRSRQAVAVRRSRRSRPT